MPSRASFLTSLRDKCHAEIYYKNVPDFITVDGITKPTIPLWQGQYNLLRDRVIHEAPSNPEMTSLGHASIELSDAIFYCDMCATAFPVSYTAVHGEQGLFDWLAGIESGAAQGFATKSLTSGV